MKTRLLLTTILFISYWPVTDYQGLEKRNPASLFSSKKLNLDSSGEELGELIRKVFLEEVSFNELSKNSKELMGQMFESYFDPNFKQRDRLIEIIVESTGLKEKLIDMSFVDEVSVRSLTTSINDMKEIGPLLWSLANPVRDIKEIKEIATTIARDGAVGEASAELASFTRKQIMNDFSAIGSVAIRRGVRKVLTSKLDQIYMKPGMAIPRDGAELRLFLDFIHTLELYKISKSVDELSDYSDILFEKMNIEFPLMSRQLEGLAKTPNGMFLHIELKSALSLFIQELDEPQAFLELLKGRVSDDMDELAKKEVHATIDSLKKGVETSSKLLRNSAEEGVFKKGLRFGLGHVLSTGDELSLGLHLFRHYGNEILTRENDNPALKGARLLLNTAVNSTAYTGKGAGLIIEKTYQYVGAVDPNFSTAVKGVKATISTIASPVDSTRKAIEETGRLSDECFKVLKGTLLRKK